VSVSVTVREDIQPARLDRSQGVRAVLNAGYQVRVSDETEDPDWDAFLAHTPGGHHVQTSLWAQVKALLGWRAVRVVVTQGDQIAAGAQMLLRPLSLVGSIGYVPKGPLVASRDPLVARLVIDELEQVARAHRSQYVVVQPPCNAEIIGDQLLRRGFEPSSTQVAPVATVMVDLAQDLDDILAHMKAGTRRNVRLGQRKGITVREGTPHDLPAFHRLLVATGQRQGFSAYPEEYFAEMWRVLGPHGYVRLLLAEYAGEAVSAVLLIPFGDTVIYKKGAWSGQHGNRRPNEALHWTAITWAKAQGYRYYDFEGIDAQAARAIMEGESLPEGLAHTVTRFKLGFGGQVVLCPEPYEFIYNRALRWTYAAVYRKIANWSVMENVLNRLRTG
jgi:lipid II:glycine glycyltransferase (peptidoglycan interpeptide bridge formation enzyme)